MNKVVISPRVHLKLQDIEFYLRNDLKFSKEAAARRVNRIRVFLKSLTPVHAICRFERWHCLGYRCVPFGGWVFAYEAFPEGIVIRDMSHGAALTDTLTK